MGAAHRVLGNRGMVMRPSEIMMAYETHKADATKAFELFRAYCSEALPHVPGMSTVIRLAVRIASGRTIGEAAAREYVYRWHLAIKAGDQVTCGSCVVNERGERSDAVSIFGAPHCFGM